MPPVLGFDGQMTGDGLGLHAALLGAMVVVIVAGTRHLRRASRRTLG
jgi:hypothetical protein